MDSFSEAYNAAKAALATGNLDGEFKKLQTGLKSLLSGSSPNLAERAKLVELRDSIAAGAKQLASAGLVGPAASAKVVVTGAGTSSGKAERAATLKVLSHLYHQKSSGGQQIWVYAPPLAYSKWIFDEVVGADDVTLQAALAKGDPEVYSADQRATMAHAVQQARAVALAVVAKLGSPNDATKAVVRRYFGNAVMPEKELLDVMATLTGGYLRIAAACNDGNIVISDEPIDRNGGGWKDWAFIYFTETMSVIYLQGAWLKKAEEISPSNQSPLHRCARTVIHELSHKQVMTEDIVYGPKGLKPEGSSALTPEYALHNADSWAYFAMDVLGYLTGPDKANGQTPSAAILKIPTRTLVTS